MDLFELSHYAWNPYGLAPAVVGVLVALLGLLVLLREQWSPVSMAFFGMTAEWAVWLVGSAGMLFSGEPMVALKWARIENAGVVFLPSMVYLFTLAVTGRLRPHRAWVLAALTASCVFAFWVAFTDLFITRVIRFWWGYYAQYGPLSIPFLFFFSLLMVVSLSCFWREYRRVGPGTHKRRIGMFLLAFTIAYAGAADFAATFGVPLYPFGYVPALLYLAIVAHGVWRYRLLDITPAFAAAQILKTVSDALLVFDREGVVRVANQAACDLFERSERQLVGQPIWRVDSAFFPKERMDAFVRTQVIHSYEAVRCTQQGKRMVLDVAVSGIRDDLDDPAAVVCVARDVSERRLAEEELRRVHEALKRTHEELKSAQMQVIQAAKMESVGRLAAGIAHEVKNPLAVILQGLDYLNGHLESRDRNVSVVLQDGREAVHRADRVLRGLLDFSALKSLEMMRENLNDVIERALMLVKYPRDQAHVRLECKLDPQLPLLAMDRQKMEQVFVNLFMNAVHAMPQGGVLTVRTLTRLRRERIAGAERIDPELGQVGQMRRFVAAQVEDTGSGIPEQHLPRIFDPFFTTKPAGKGTGLGLTVTKNLVELHDGTIEIRNQPSGGVQVTLLFPEGGKGSDGGKS